MIVSPKEAPPTGLFGMLMVECMKQKQTSFEGQERAQEEAGSVYSKGLVFRQGMVSHEQNKD